MSTTRDRTNNLSYPERWERACRQHVTVDIVVPKPGKLGNVRTGSGLVVAPYGEDDDVRSHVYFEGFLYGAAQWDDVDAVQRWEAAVRIAADRAVVRYPTVAQAYVPVADIDVVGSLACATGVLTVTEPELVTRWLTTSRSGLTTGL